MQVNNEFMVIKQDSANKFIIRTILIAHLTHLIRFTNVTPSESEGSFLQKKDSSLRSE